MQAHPVRVTSRITVIACSLVSLLPLLICWPQFSRLFFFDDDWEIARWSGQAWVESLARRTVSRRGHIPPSSNCSGWAPFRLTGGSYFGLILLLWGTHIVICVLLGWLLARFGLRPAAIAFALLSFGLAWTNLETLTWAMQWNSQLALVFFLAAWHFLLGTHTLDRRAAACLLCLLASGLCSSRGIVLRGGAGGLRLGKGRRQGTAAADRLVPGVKRTVCRGDVAAGSPPCRSAWRSPALRLRLSALESAVPAAGRRCGNFSASPRPWPAAHSRRRSFSGLSGRPNRPLDRCCGLWSPSISWSLRHLAIAAGQRAFPPPQARVTNTFRCCASARWRASWSPGSGAECRSGFCCYAPLRWRYLGNGMPSSGRLARRQVARRRGTHRSHGPLRSVKAHRGPCPGVDTALRSSLTSFAYRAPSPPWWRDRSEIAPETTSSLCVVFGNISPPSPVLRSERVIHHSHEHISSAKASSGIH